MLGTPQIPTNPVTIFLDVEGKPEEAFDYLIGMVVVRNGLEERRSFWADAQDQEHLIFEQFLDEIERLDDFVVYCYGGYEKAFLTRLRRKTERKDLVDKVLKAQVNVLSLVYSPPLLPDLLERPQGRCPLPGLLMVRRGGVWVSPGASKPATHGRFKTSHRSWGKRASFPPRAGPSV